MKIFSGISLILLAGCQTAAPPPESAVIVDRNPQMVEELEKTMTTALYGVPIKLTEEAFSSSSILTLEPQQQTTPAGRLASGRTMTHPQQFRLLSIAGGCVLEHANTGDRFALVETKCQAEVTVGSGTQ
jgi:hypothetical protein